MPLAEVSKGRGHILNSFGQNRLAFQLCFGITKFVPPTVPKLMPCVNSMKVSRTYVLYRHLVRKILAKYYSDSVFTPVESFILRQGDQVTSLKASLVCPIAEYARIAWLSHTTKDISTIESLQQRSARFVFNHYSEPTVVPLLC